MNLNAKETYWNSGWTKIESLPSNTAFTVASATSSTLTVSGHLGTNLAGTDNQNVNASATQCLIEVDVETIGASLGCAVDKVRTTHAHTSDRAHRHDGAVPLCFELLAQQDTNRYWCGEVNLCRFHGLCLV